MEIFDHLLYGFRLAYEPMNLLMCFVGVALGTLVGVLPGLGPVATISLLLPITYKLSSVQSIIMLAGIYYGAQYGGSTTSILLRIPGEASTMITCLDGHEMAKKGRGGAALGISAIGSFIGGSFAIVMLTFLAPPIASIALSFGPPENASLMALGLIMVTYLASGSLLKALMMTVTGLLLGTIGAELITGEIRFTFGILGLTEGVGVIPVVMGLFGISEVLVNIEKSFQSQEAIATGTKFRDVLPTKKEFKVSSGPIGRGSILGFFLGVIPGGGALLASVASYVLEKRISDNPETFGTGNIAGVAGPETANNAASIGAYIPLLTMGIPANVVMAVLMGAFLIHGVIPGPLLIAEHPDVFWGVVGSMYLGNFMLLILNLPLVGIWVRILRVPYAMLFPLILLICVIGSYSINYSLLDIYVMIAFGIFGYLMKKFDYPSAPLCLALILGPLVEKHLGQSLMMANGDFKIFVSRPISGIMIALGCLILISPLGLKLIRKKLPQSIIEDG
jgi:putative tricarboxylic transport membrane protein